MDATRCDGCPEWGCMDCPDSTGGAREGEMDACDGCPDWRCMGCPDADPWTPPAGTALCGVCALYGVRTPIPHEASAAGAATLHLYGGSGLCARVALCPDCHDAAGDDDGAEDGCRECADPTPLYGVGGAA